jgi:hypothetical protein
MRIILSTYFILTLILLATCQGQEKSILVVKLLTEDGYPVPDQVVKLDSTELKSIKLAITDSTGCVIFDNLYPCEYSVRGGVHGELQATGTIKLLSAVRDTLTIIQGITKKYFLEMEKE